MSNKITIWDESDGFIYGTFKNKLEIHNCFRQEFKMNCTYQDEEFEVHNPLGDLNDKNYLDNEIKGYLCMFGLSIKEEKDVS
tara:strand:+ start:53 stop:298 length:246 start_codon:yes stop_codon:yes gene_type:complete